MHVPIFQVSDFLSYYEKFRYAVHFEWVILSAFLTHTHIQY